MKIKPIARVMTATALTNPDPSFVSMCAGPANQTPFHAVRSDDSIHADVTLEDSMKIKRSKATSAVVVAERGHSVMQFAFDKQTFKSADDVTKWLEAGGYQDYTIVETSKSFEVSDNSGTRFEVGSTQVVKNAAPGLTAYVAKLANASDEDQIVDDAEPAPTDTTVTPVAKTEVTARTRVRTGAAPSEAPEGAPAVVETPEQVEAASRADADAAEVAARAAAANAVVEALQPVAGVTDTIDAELKTKIDAILADHPVVAKKVSGYSISDVAGVIATLRYIVGDADYSGIDDTTILNLKTAAKSALSAIVSMVAQYSTEMTEVFKSDASATVVRSEAEPAAPVAPVVEPAPEPTVDAPLTAAAVAEIVAKAVAPLTAEVTALTARVADAETAESEARQRAEQAEGELAARVEADASRSQSRKAEDDIDPPASTTNNKEKPAERTRSQNRILESFGSRHAR